MCGSATSCESPSSVSASSIAGTRALPVDRATARPRDLDASVRFAAAEMDMVILRQRVGEGGERIYRLRSVRDEPAWLIASSVSGWGEPRDARPIALRAKVTRLGDGDRERELVRRVADRLRYLRERDPR